MAKIDIVSEVIDNAVNIRALLNILNTKGITVTQKEWDEARDQALAALQEKFGYQIVKLDYSFSDMVSVLSPLFTPLYNSDDYREAYRQLKSGKVEKLAELRAMVADQEVLGWLKKAYREELLREQENPLDPASVCTWGVILHRRGLDGQAQAEVLRAIRASSEAKEARTKLLERKAFLRINQNPLPPLVLNLGQGVALTRISDIEIIDIDFGPRFDVIVARCRVHAGVPGQGDLSFPASLQGVLRKSDREFEGFTWGPDLPAKPQANDG